MARVKTVHIPSFIEEKVATNLYERLRDNTEWKEGVRSKNGFTRLAYRIDNFDTIDDDIKQIILKCVKKCISADKIGVAGVYYNYYKDGNHYTPNHTHPGTMQLIISLGATRTLTIGKKNYPMANGDIALFGSSSHGIPKEPLVTEGRISIALFLLKN